MAYAGILMNMINHDIEELEAQHNLNIERRNIRDMGNPFELPTEFFKKLFRFERNMAQDIIEMVSPFMVDGTYSSAVPKHLRVLAALNFFAQGGYQKSVGQDFKLGLSQTMISRAISEVSDIFVDHLLNQHIVFPIGDHVNRVKRGFFDKFGIGGIIGTIDGTHVAIVAPSTEDPEHPPVVYYNRKGFYSLNIQVICDSDLVILAANARFPGSTHDSAIWAESGIRRQLSTQYNAGVRSTWLLGDSGYPLEPWLLTPVQDAQAGTPEARYTRQHCRIRNTVERCIGVLKMRFRCLTKTRALYYHPIRAGKIIYSCIILHNLALQFRLHDPENYEAENPMPNEIDMPVQNNLVGGNELLAVARRVRATVIRNYFDH